MAPTGAGKTVIALQIIKDALANNKKVVFVVDRIQLIDQTVEKFVAAGLFVGVIQADHILTRPYANVQIASAQTLIRRDNLPECDLLLVDECHTTYGKLFDLMNEQIEE